MNDPRCNETLEERIARVVRETVAVVPYDPDWPESFWREKEHLEACLPGGLIRRIEHFGSTAIPGMAAKPIIDMLVEVVSLKETRKRVVPILERQGYEYFWRPGWGEDGVPWYAWLIKRDALGVRTHHLHMVECSFPHWDAILFRDYLVEHAEAARAYATLKIGLARQYANDRVGYTKAKAEFITTVTEQAKRARGEPSSADSGN